MPDTRPGVKLDFTTGLEKLPAKPNVDPVATTLASVAAGREMGFSARQDPPPLQKLDGRRLRSRGANTQMNLKVTDAEKEMILGEAMRHIQDPMSQISNIGEFVVMAVEHYKRHRRP